MLSYAKLITKEHGKIAPKPNAVRMMIISMQQKAGATALCNRLEFAEFYSTYEPTSGVDLFTLVNNGIHYHIWDAANFSNATNRIFLPIYLKNISAIFMVCDCTKADNFEKSITGLLQLLPTQPISKTLVCSKIDLRKNHHRVLSTADGQKYAKKAAATYVECSAKTGEGISKLRNIIYSIEDKTLCSTQLSGEYEREANMHIIPAAKFAGKQI